MTETTLRGFAVGEAVTARGLSTAHYFRELPPGGRAVVACGLWIRLDREVVPAPAGMPIHERCALTVIGMDVAAGRLPGGVPAPSKPALAKPAPPLAPKVPVVLLQQLARDAAAFGTFDARERMDGDAILEVLLWLTGLHQVPRSGALRKIVGGRTAAQYAAGDVERTAPLQRRRAG